jgi:L-2,4-diaminobutyric acid acetyltransferase
MNILYVFLITSRKTNEENIMEIRNFANNDTKEIIELVSKSRPYVVPYNMYTYWILQNYYGSTCKVIQNDDRLLGYISAIPSIDKNTLFIWQLCIDEEYRGKGLGTMLITSIISEANVLGYDNIQFSISETNIASQTLFKNFAEKSKSNIYEKDKIQFEEITEILFQIDI